MSFTCLPCINNILYILQGDEKYTVFRSEGVMGYDDETQTII